MDYPIRAESGKGRSAHIFNLNERAVLNLQLCHGIPAACRHGLEYGGHVDGEEGEHGHAHD